MSIVPHATPDVAGDLVAAVIAHLHGASDGAVRAAAATALGHLPDPRAAPALAAALLDPDPDVRADAMAALAGCAGPAEAAAIRRSLVGDPVGDVKLKAIEALCRLEDGASIPLLRALARDRCEGDVAWDDEDGLWDDWLDVQLAAIAALGRLQVADAVSDLLEARRDEFAQELDQTVFAALAQIPGPGIAALLELSGDAATKIRLRALTALATADAAALSPLARRLAGDPHPEIRILALGGLEAESPAVAALALEDGDPAVRAACLSAFGAARPDLARAALADADERVRAAALDALPDDHDDPAPDDLAANLLAWIATGGPQLAARAATAVARLSPAAACAPLSAAAGDLAQAPELRTAALRALAGIASHAPDAMLSTLRACAVDSSRHIRVAALAVAAELAASAPRPLQTAAADLLASAIAGALADEAAAEEPDVTAAADRADSRTTIAIAPDGTISQGGAVPPSSVERGLSPRSTLDALQASIHRPENRAAPVRRRVAIDSIEDSAEDIRVMALGAVGDCLAEPVERAVTDALSAPEAPVRRAAFRALAHRADAPVPDVAVSALAAAALQDGDPELRGYAAQILVRCGPAADAALGEAAGDPDPLVRALAVRHLSRRQPDVATDALADPSPMVRAAGLSHWLAAEDDAAVGFCVERLVGLGHLDTLVEACRASATARDAAVHMVCSPDLPRRDLIVLLQALGTEGQTAAAPSIG